MTLFMEANYSLASSYSRKLDTLFPDQLIQQLEPDPYDHGDVTHVRPVVAVRRPRRSQTPLLRPNSCSCSCSCSIRTNVSSKHQDGNLNTKRAAIQAAKGNTVESEAAKGEAAVKKAKRKRRERKAKVKTTPAAKEVKPVKVTPSRVNVPAECVNTPKLNNLATNVKNTHKPAECVDTLKVTNFAAEEVKPVKVTSVKTEFDIALQNSLKKSMAMLAWQRERKAHTPVKELLYRVKLNHAKLEKKSMA